jgi:serine/threonine protein kinase
VENPPPEKNKIKIRKHRRIEADAAEDLLNLKKRLPERWLPLRPLGRGGMGCVYLCRDVALNRAVAIKLILERHGEDARMERRFLREAQIQAGINHPNITAVLNAGVTTDGQPFLVLEYVDGRDLREALAAEGPFVPDRACRLGRLICEGLAEAHRLGIVHRDLKPANVILFRDHRGVEQLKITDLGLAKIVGGMMDLRDANMETTRILAGTPAYMSPEQVVAGPLDGRSDLYSLGIVLYELLTGRLPFEAETLDGWAERHLRAKPPPLSGFRKELAAWPKLEEAVLWALAKEPHERPNRAEDFANLLRRAGVRERTTVLLKTEKTERLELDSPPPPDAAAPSPPSLPSLIPSQSDRNRKILETTTALGSSGELEKTLAEATREAEAGDWPAVEKQLTVAALHAAENKPLAIFKAALPQMLAKAWLRMARRLLERLPADEKKRKAAIQTAVACAGLGDLREALAVVTEFSTVTRAPSGNAAVLFAYVVAGFREGFRPAFDLAVVNAAQLPPNERTTVFKTLGTAVAEYGDLTAAAKCFRESLRVGKSAFEQMRSTTKTDVRETAWEQRAPRKQWDALIREIAEAQAAVGLPEEAEMTAQISADPWVQGFSLAASVEALAASGQMAEARRLAAKISLGLPRARALRSIAAALVAQNQPCDAEALLKEISLPEELGPLLGLLAASWMRQGEMEKGAALAQTALEKILEITGTSARFETMLQTVELLLKPKTTGLEAPFLDAALQLADAAENSAERVRRLLALAEIQVQGRVLDKHGALTEEVRLTEEAVRRLLLRACGALRDIADDENREALVQRLAYLCGLSELANVAGELIPLCRTNFERLAVWNGLAEGIL